MQLLGVGVHEFSEHGFWCGRGAFFPLHGLEKET